MNSNQILQKLVGLEESNDGLILLPFQVGTLFLNYGDETKTMYRYEAFMKDDDMKSLIHIGPVAESRGVTYERVIQVLKAAFKDKYYDALCTLNGLVVCDTDEEFVAAMNKIHTYTDDILTEWYNWDDYEDFLGHMLGTHKIIVINSDCIMRAAQEIADSDPCETVSVVYWRGVAQTIIHEAAHLMMDTNLCLDKEDFITDNNEECIEEFCREAYDALPVELR